MKKVKKIKVIKKNDIGVTTKPIVEKKNSEELTTRIMVSTVSKWVDELQERRFTEAKATVDRLNKRQPQNA